MLKLFGFLYGIGFTLAMIFLILYTFNSYRRNSIYESKIKKEINKNDKSKKV